MSKHHSGITFLRQSNASGSRQAARKSSRWVLTAVLLASQGLAACSSGSGDGANRGVPVSACESISGGGAQFSTAQDPLCAGCSVSAGHNSIDGNFDTFTQISMSAVGAGGIDLRAIAQHGIVYPAGNRAGAIVNAISIDPVFYEKELTGIFSVRTYLDGALQEVVHAAPAVIEPEPLVDAPSFVGGRTTKPFDAVELNFYAESLGLRTYLYVFEFCGNAT